MSIGLLVLATLGVIAFIVARRSGDPDMAALEKTEKITSRDLRRAEARLFERQCADPAVSRISQMYIEMHRRMGDPTPESTVREMVQEALKRASRQTPSLSGKGAGQQLLRLGAESPELQHYVKVCRDDGVHDDDFELWWSLHEVERQMVILDDERWTAHALVLEYKRSGELERAADRVARHRVSYRSFLAPPAPAEPQGEDRHLPYELKDRVNRWIEGQERRPGPLFPPQSSSANAYIRHLVRKGEI